MSTDTFECDPEAAARVSALLELGRGELALGAAAKPAIVLRAERRAVELEHHELADESFF